jgi:cysteine desulfurase
VGAAGLVWRYGRGVGAYLDAATAVPLHPVARQALHAAMDDGWADPGKLYAQARRARQLLDAARSSTADSLGVRPDEVFFTASGTAAVRLAVRGGLTGRRRAGATLVHSAIEHSSVLFAAEEHVAAGGRAVSVPVDRSGRVDADAWRAAVAEPGVAMAALISASHEVGTVQPVAVESPVPVFVDAAQSVPWGPVPGEWSILAASAHKWGGPPGVGVLVVRKGVRFPPVPEEQAALPAIVSAAASLRAVHDAAASEGARLGALVDRIRTTVPATVPDVEVVGHPVDRLPNVVTFSCLYVDGEALLHALDQRGFAVSSGSSCTSSTLTPSHVLAAMGVLTHGNVRVSLHAGTLDTDVDRFLGDLPDVVASVRAQAGASGL